MEESRRPNRIGRRVALLLAYAAVLAVILLIANLGGTTRVFSWVFLIPYGDKVGHFTLMGILAGLVGVALPWRWFPLGSVATFLLVLAEELTQLWLPTRSFDLVDLAADGAGIALATALVWAFHPGRRPQTGTTPA